MTAPFSVPLARPQILKESAVFSLKAGGDGLYYYFRQTIGVLVLAIVKTGDHLDINCNFGQEKRT